MSDRHPRLDLIASADALAAEAMRLRKIRRRLSATADRRELVEIAQRLDDQAVALRLLAAQTALVAPAPLVPHG